MRESPMEHFLLEGADVLHRPTPGVRLSLCLLWNHLLLERIGILPTFLGCPGFRKNTGQVSAPAAV